MNFMIDSFESKLKGWDRNLILDMAMNYGATD